MPLAPPQQQDRKIGLPTSSSSGSAASKGEQGAGGPVLRAWKNAQHDHLTVLAQIEDGPPSSEAIDAVDGGSHETRIVSGCRDGTLKLWRATRGSSGSTPGDKSAAASTCGWDLQAEGTVVRHSAAPVVTACAAGAGLLVSVSADRSMKLWRTQDNRRGSGNDAA